MEPKDNSGVDKIKQELGIANVESLFNSAYIEVVIPGDDIKYRLKKPALKEMKIAEKKKADRFSLLLQDKNVLSIKQIVSLLEEREMISKEETKTYKEDQDKYVELMKELAQIKTPEAELIDKYKDQIRMVVARMKIYDGKIQNYVVNSLEYQIKLEYDMWICFLCSEKLDGTFWRPVWNSFDEFNADEDRGFEFIQQYYAYQGDITDFILGGWLNPQSGV